MSKNKEAKLKLNESYGLPFHHKQQIILTKSTHNYFQSITKSFAIAKKDRLIFEHVWRKVKDYQKATETTSSQFSLQKLDLTCEEKGDHLCYDLVRPFIKSNTLKECLLHEQFGLTANRFTIAQLITSYARTIHLNHIICSADNIYVGRNYSKQVNFRFNHTSIGFILDLYRGKDMCRQDVIEYANYLPRWFYRNPTEKRFDFYLKLRSLAVNLCCIVMERNISFFEKYYVDEANYTQQQICSILEKTNDFFQQFFKNSEVQRRVAKVSEVVGQDLMKFFRVVILQAQSSAFNQFDSWGKIINYFQIQCFSSYSSIFELEFKSEFGEISSELGPYKKGYLQSWILLKWNQESDYIKEKFISLGIVNAHHVKQLDLMLYLLYRYNIINYPRFSINNQLFQPQLFKLTIRFYSQILESDLIIEQQHLKVESTILKYKRNKFLTNLIRKLNESLTEVFLKSSEVERIVIYVASNRIDLKDFEQLEWWSGK